MLKIVDKSGEPSPKPRKTANVKIVRRPANQGGNMIVVDGDSPTLSEDIHYMFAANVRKAIRSGK